MNNPSNGTDRPGNVFNEKLFSLLAHDLKNTFNTVISISQYLSTGIDSMPREELDEYLSVIRKTSTDMNMTLENFISLNRIKSGSTVKPSVRINPYPAIINIASDMTAMYKASGKLVDVVFFGNEDMTIGMDELSFSLVIRNILSNAFKFSDDNGKIVIHASEEEGKAVISVSDEGCGMTAEDVDNFNKGIPFSKPGTTGEKGTGLGLMLCREILDMYGGRIGFDCGQEKGCCVRVEVGG